MLIASQNISFLIFFLMQMLIATQRGLFDPKKTNLKTNKYLNQKNKKNNFLTKI